MAHLDQPIEKAMQVELENIRQSVQRLASDTRAAGAFAPTIDAGDASRIVHRLHDWLLDDEQQQVLRNDPWALFFLHAACLLDIEPADAGKHAQGSGATERMAVWIEENWGALGFGDKKRALIAARIFGKMTDPPEPGNNMFAADHETYADASIPTGLIAAGVRLARSLELKSPKTFAKICAFLPDDLTAADLIDAFDVLHIGPHPYLTATIQVKLRCRTAELHRALKHHESTVLGDLNTFNQRVRPRFLFSELIYEIEPQGYQPVDLKFKVDSTSALKLFMGNRLYADKRVFLRELIQNAVDACNLRKLVDSAHVAAISIKFNQDISQISVRDNGIGMDHQWLEKYFLTVGLSFYQSDEIKSVNRDPRINIGFISQFGIGFLSSFLVAEKIVVRTRKKTKPGMMITITHLEDYFDVRFPDEELPTGTEVTLHLKPSTFNYSRSLEFAGYLKTNLRFLQIPVEFIDEHGDRQIIGNEPLSYASQYAGVGDFVAPIAFDDSEGYVYLQTKVHDSRIFALESAIGGVSVFQDGIFIRQDDTLLPEGARQNIVGRINLRGRDKCELSMDRNRIFWTADQKKHVREQVLMALAEVANLVLSRLHEQGAPNHITTSITNQLSIFFEFGWVNDAIHDQLCDALQRIVDKRFRNFVRIHFAHTGSAAGVPDADGYGEAWQRRILASFAAKN